MARTLEQQLNLYLQDAHAIERQALEQVRRAPKIAGDPEIAKAFELHIRKTEQHRLYVEDLLLARSWKPVPQKDMAAKLSGVGMALFARFHVEGRLQARGASPSALKDAALRLGALNLGILMRHQVDTPAKLAAFAYAFEHLEIASYELLRRVAQRVKDDETVVVADRILAEERAAAAAIHERFDDALEAALQEAGVGA